MMLMCSIAEKLKRADPSLGQKLHIGDLLTVYHPHSALPSTISHYPGVQHGTRLAARPSMDTSRPASSSKDSANANDSELSSDSESHSRRRPWHPWNELLDFEFAELALDAHLNEAQITKLLSIIHKVAKDEGKFTLHSYVDLQKSWEAAQVLTTPVRRFSLIIYQTDSNHVHQSLRSITWKTVQYKTKVHSVDVHSLPIWDWVLDQLHNPKLIPHTVWDAHRSYRYDGQTWVKTIGEPFSASRAWNVQVSSPTTIINITCIWMI